ncbi:3190_t:CDS:2 [Scutellospora calospora]|uniref:3190_t:CDS:1 n=1 Tax=Scutellospora calospora TaxID=85575 RepID=A0ACA9K626_9GLOM|nr:3190_t:CDS:2 [Scutellospora calospora]
MSSLTSSSPGWKSAVRKVKKKVDSMVHNYPELPKTLPREDRWIGSKISVKNYNIFLDRNEKIGYKFYWENNNVYIIDMANREHEAVVSYLQECFRVPNNGVKRGPLKILGQPSPDIAVCPNNAHVSQPLILHPGPPPGDGRPHARFICEVANAQSIDYWNTKCEAWMHEKYVRCVFGIKIYPKKIIGITVHRQMIARLWTRGASAGSVLSADVTLEGAGVYVKEWDFGTIQYNNNTPTPTGCNALNLNAFQVTIPISDAFYDPPIIRGVPAEYAVFVPGTVVGVNFVIDLYEIQQEVLDAQ